MREYPDPKKFLQQRVTPTVQEYLDGLKQRGLEDNPIVQQAFIKKALDQAQTEFEQELNTTFEHNMRIIVQQHRKRDHQIKREGAHAALVLCPIVMLMFGGSAWLNLHQGDLPMAVLFSSGALIFLAMLVAALARLRK